jgi:hypothetical protein
VIMYMTASTLGQSVAGPLFGLVLLAFVVLVLFIFAGVRGSGRVSF